MIVMMPDTDKILKVPKGFVIPRYRLVVEVQFNDRPVKDVNHPSALHAEKKYSIHGKYKISILQLTEFEDFIFCYFACLYDDRFDIYCKYHHRAETSFYVDLRQHYKSNITTEPVEVVFRLADDVNTDLSMYDGVAPVFHYIKINNEPFKGTWGSRDKLNEVREEMAKGDYSSFIYVRKEKDKNG